MSTLIAEFVSESAENLDRVDQDFVVLEKQPGDQEILARIFRALHTLKGSCGFLGFSRLEALAHSGESLLGMLRSGSLALTPVITTALLEAMDQIRRSLAVVEATGGEGDTQYDGLIAKLDALREGRDVPGSAAAAAPSAQTGGERQPTSGMTARQAWEDRQESLRQALRELDRAFMDQRGVPAPLAPLSAAFTALARIAAEFPAIAEVAAKAARLATGPDSAALRSVLLEAGLFADEALAAIAATGAAPVTVPAKLSALMDGASAPHGRSAAGHRSHSRQTGTATHPPQQTRAEPPRPQPAQVAPNAAPTAGPAASDHHRDDVVGRRGSVSDSKIRVDVKLLDNLMNQVGELVLARNQILQSLSSRDSRVPARITQRLSQITTDLQASVMRTRLQPMEIIWNRIPRTVRDLGMELGKQIELVMEGADTELDRSLLDAIRDPMMHLVRNAIDHGIETEAERVALGKKPTGSLALRAWHEGGQVNVEIVDDGRGIDVARIEKKAIARGLITPEQARAMSHQEKIALIFLPGFSTAEKVTTVSGRGVGMDVVKHNIDQVNGAIDIQTEVGRGTSIRLKIPLTLAIIPALIVASAGQRYVIPQVSLLAVVSLSESGAGRGIESVHDATVFRWRGRLLPLVDLSVVLKLSGKARLADSITVVVLQAADRLFGLMVDSVVDSAEVVVKPVNRMLARSRVFAAATIMGDGRAAMILDVLGLAQRATVVTGRAEQSSQSRTTKSVTAPTAVENQQVLIVRVGQEFAVIPLTSAIRLEHFPAKAIEILGRRPVAQYRGRVLPLWQLGGADLAARDPDSVLNVVVYIEGEHSIGLVVDELVDILQRTGDIQKFHDRATGVIGGTIVLNRVAQVLDLPALAREASA